MSATPHRLALYAHYANTPVVRRYVLHYLATLRQLGYRVHFLSNSPIDAASETALSLSCDRITVRPNVGCDFAMWQQGLATVEASALQELLLTNSSIIGPFQPLAPLWDSPSIRHCDFWGMTDNLEFGHHLQSYFLVFRRRVLESPAFKAFWSAVLPYRSRDQVVLSYEVGLTVWLADHGFSWAPLFKQDEVLKQFLQQRNPIVDFAARARGRRFPGWNVTLFYPDLLIRSGMPFLKLHLLRVGNRRISTRTACRLLEDSSLAREIKEELLADFAAGATG